MAKGCGTPKKMARGGSISRNMGSRIGTRVAGFGAPSTRQRSRNLRASAPPSDAMTMPSAGSELNFAKGGCAKKGKC